MANDTISDVLNMNPLQEADSEDRKNVLPTVYKEDRNTSSEQETDDDLKYVRKNLYDLIEKGHGAIDELLNIADQSQHPRSYEVLSGLVKTMVETNKELVNLHHEKQKLQGKPEQPVSSKTVNNNLFVGSTSDLLKIIKDDE